MTNEKLKQIEADAEAYQVTIGSLMTHYDNRPSYISGATAEADKAAALVEALEVLAGKIKDAAFFRATYAMETEVEQMIFEALNNYKKQ